MWFVPCRFPREFKGAYNAMDLINEPNEMEAGNKHYGKGQVQV